MVKKLVTLVLTSMIILAGANAQTFKAGAYAQDITPRLGTLINGGFFSGYTQKIHDPLHARAIVMEKNKTTVVLVIVDICYMESPFIDGVKTIIQKETGIQPGNILIAATHAHSAGAVETWCLANADIDYRLRLPSLIAKSVREARKKLRPAQIAFGNFNAPEHVVCRRYFLKDGYTSKNPVTGGIDKVKTNPGGVPVADILGPVAAIDPQFSYMAVKGSDNKWIALLGNYSMHYVGDVEANTISADYFGEFSKQVKQKLDAPDDFVGLLSNGTSGDANIVDFMHPNRYPDQSYAKTQMIANDLSEKVIKGLGELKWEKNPDLQVKFRKLPVAIRKPSAEEITKAEEAVAGTDFTNMGQYTDNDDQLRRMYALEQLVVKEMGDSIEVRMQAIKIGRNIIGGLGGEIFSATGLYLKKKSPVPSYFTISNANGYVGYVPTAEDLELGGYETWRCRSSLLEKTGESLIRENLLDLISELK